MRIWVDCIPCALMAVSFYYICPDLRDYCMWLSRKIDRHKWLKESQLHLDEIATELNENEVMENKPFFSTHYY